MLKKCCFTGYRPEKLPYLRDEKSADYQKLQQLLAAAVSDAIEDGYNYFISGFARGIDLMAAEIVVSRSDPSIILEAAIPCLNQTRGWRQSDVELYRELLSQAKYKCYLDKVGNRASYLKRNRYMVEKSQRIIAVYDGQSGGTAHTLNYARKLQREIVLINPVAFTVTRPEPNLFTQTPLDL